jgi:hypothetical protein
LIWCYLRMPLFMLSPAFTISQKVGWSSRGSNLRPLRFKSFVFWNELKGQTLTLRNDCQNQRRTATKAI